MGMAERWRCGGGAVGLDGGSNVLQWVDMGLALGLCRVPFGAHSVRGVGVCGRSDRTGFGRIAPSGL